MIARCRPLLGTFVEITIDDGDADAVESAFASIRHVHERMSWHEPDSDLARLRSAPANAVVEVDRETVAVLRQAAWLHEASAGLFNIAVGKALVRGGFLPAMHSDDPEAFSGSAADIEILDDTHVRCSRRVLIDLGGIAKGHAVDLAVAALIAEGVGSGLVNAGGDLRMFGSREWPIHLRDADDVVRVELAASNCAIASSANLLDRHRIDGRLHSPHIGPGDAPVLIDGRVTVIAPQCILADAMTKVAMIDAGLADRILRDQGGRILKEPMMAGVA